MWVFIKPYAAINAVMPSSRRSLYREFNTGLISLWIPIIGYGHRRCFFFFREFNMWWIIPSFKCFFFHQSGWWLTQYWEFRGGFTSPDIFNNHYWGACGEQRFYWINNHWDDKWRHVDIQLLWFSTGPRSVLSMLTPWYFQPVININVVLILRKCK